jgi:hypothetical protein
MNRSALTALAAFSILSACEARIGSEDEAPPPESTGNGQAEEGELSIDTPGFQMKLNIPKAIADRAEVDSDSGVLYPGATLSGIHVEGRGKAGDSRVELRFNSKDDPARIAAWYRDPARAAEFSITSASQNGDVINLSGTEKEDGDPFDLSLSPRGGGGTDGRLRLRDRG